MHFLSRPRRPHRSNEWAQAKVVTFIVTLAASGSVTLAAHEARMSRKSAYALKARDPAFAAAWALAVKAGARTSREGNKVDEVHEPPVPSSQGDTLPLRSDRERAFAGLLDMLRKSPPLADHPPAQ